VEKAKKKFTKFVKKNKVDLLQVFRVMDTNLNNRLDLNEFSVGIEKMGIKLKPTSIKILFRSCDTDSNDQINIIQFIQMF
jgi:Ca2+-binding EF-hand superfamily protein